MLKVERKSFIINFLKKNKTLHVKNMSKLINVTKETIRSDLRELEKEGYLNRHHGGAILNSQVFDNLELKNIMNYSEDLERLNNFQEVKHMTNDVFILGSFNVDITNVVSKLPKPGESVLALRSSFSAGGKGANQALAANQANADVFFTTKIGIDEFNQYAKRYFETSSINNYHLFESKIEKTGCAIILVEDESGENCISISPGANMSITESEIDLIDEQIKNTKIVLLQLETNIDALHKVIQLAKKYDKTVILNPAPYNDYFISLISDIDIITPNETEASEISGILVVDIESAKLAAKKIYSMGIGIVIITLGSKGVLCFNGDEYIYMPAYPALVKNTSGAGDAFNGALASSLSSKKALANSLQYACAFASLAVETDSASGMPSHQLVMDRINQHLNKIFPKYIN